MLLNNLFTATKQRKKRVGRGIGSGLGKTCGSGHKGQKSRSGVALKAFEGGQNSLISRLPKRGFNQFRSKKYVAVSLARILNLFDEVSGDIQLVDKKFLVTHGVIKNERVKIKVVNTTRLDKVNFKIDLVCDASSASVVKLIEDAGGKVTVLDERQKPNEES